MKSDKYLRFLAVLIVLTGLILAVLACNAPLSSTGDIALDVQPTGAVVEQTEEPTPEPAEPTPTELPPDPTSVCPEPTADTLLYVDEASGFCLLYPTGFTLRSGVSMHTSHIGVMFEPSVEGEETLATLEVNVIGQPGVMTGITPAEFAEQKLNDLAVSFGEALFSQEELTLPNGLEAVVLPGQAGIFPFRSLYVAANDTMYEFTGFPTVGFDGEPIPEVELAWTTMLDSLTFFPPVITEELRIPEEICPSATADTFLVIDRQEGYCMLVPNSFEENPDFGIGSYIGGPELTGLPVSMEPRVHATLGFAGATEETVAEANARYIEAAPDKDSIILTEVSVSGYPAIFWDRPQYIVPHRSALIMVDGYLYTLLVQPVDPVNYPEAVEPAELAWNTIIDSLVFFEPWQ